MVEASIRCGWEEKGNKREKEGGAPERG